MSRRSGHDADAVRNERTQDLFDRLSSTDSPEEQACLKTEITELYLDLARSLARRYRGRGEPEEDIVQAANVGLMKAINGFRPDRGFDFLSYAVPTITGEIKKHFRDCCWTVRVPRAVQELQASVTATGDDLRHALHREPTCEELADRLGECPENVVRALRAHECYTPRSLDTTIAGERIALADTIADTESGYGEVETRVVLASAVRRLPARDRELLAMRFFEGLTQREIGDRIGVSQMQVSRRLSGITSELRETLSPEP